MTTISLRQTRRGSDVPQELGFATKPAIARAMIERALAVEMPFSWVAADSVYGVGDIEMALRRAGKGYVLGVSAKHAFNSWASPMPLPEPPGILPQTCPRRHGSAYRLAQEPRESAFMTGPISNWPTSMLRISTRTSASSGPEVC